MGFVYIHYSDHSHSRHFLCKGWWNWYEIVLMKRSWGYCGGMDISYESSTLRSVLFATQFDRAVNTSSKITFKNCFSDHSRDTFFVKRSSQIHFCVHALVTHHGGWRTRQKRSHSSSTYTVCSCSSSRKWNISVITCLLILTVAFVWRVFYVCDRNVWLYLSAVWLYWSFEIWIVKATLKYQIVHEACVPLRQYFGPQLVLPVVVTGDQFCVCENIKAIHVCTLEFVSSPGALVTY